jgi:chromosome partitioning protein
MKPKMLISDIAEFMDITTGRLHQIIGEREIPVEKESNRSFINYEGAKVLFKIPFEKKVISFQTVKGGVGKTTLCHSIGTRASLYGAKILFLDIDQQANLTGTFCLDNETLGDKCIKNVVDKSCSIEDVIVPVCEGIDLIPSNIKNAVLDKLIMLETLPLDKVLKKELAKIRQNYDFIFIDCPPSISPLVSAATLSSDLVVSPLTPDKYGMDGLKMCAKEVEGLNKNYEKNIDYKVILNKYDKRTILSPAIFNLIEENSFFKGKLISSFISTTQEFSNASIEQRSIFCATRQTNACKDIDAITRELIFPADHE